MLQRLLNEEVAQWWPLLHDGIAKSLPPTASEEESSLSNIMLALIQGRMQIWLEEEEGKVRGFVITAITIEEFSKTKNLWIFSLFSDGTLSAEKWKEGLSTIREYAKKSGCNKIVGFTIKPIVESIVAKLGGRAINTLVEFEL